MKAYFFIACSAMLLVKATPVFSAEDDNDKMKIEKVIVACEEKYTEDKYPDADERNKLIDKCIEENSPSGSQSE